MRTSFAVFLILASVSLYAEHVDCPGKIVYDHGAVDVVFVLPLASSISLAYDQMESGVFYYNQDNQRVNLPAGIAKEITFVFDDELVKMKSLVYTAFDGRVVSIFLKVVLEGGDVNVYQQYYPAVAYTFPVANTLGATKPTEWIPEGVGYVLQKGKSEPTFCGKVFGFRKIMRKYFRDCPSLTDLIKHRAFRKADVLTIANFYNTRCNQPPGAVDVTNN
jgi:hypothetical protein